MIGTPIEVNGITISSQSIAGAGRQGTDSMKQLRLKQTLQKLIAERKITLRELSKETGVPQSTLSSYLAGASTSKPEYILVLAKYFGVSMETLLFGQDERAPTLDEVMTDGLFEGWLKVRIERAIPGKKKFSGDGGKS